ncbi:MAG TPA: VanW family protein [Patescibacteria group bacterium]|nr:VanW family protein [Patescibacteria group bacterium]
MSSARSIVNKKLPKKPKNFGRSVVIFFFSVIVFVLGFFLFYQVKYLGRIYPNIYIAGISLGGQTPAEAVATLTNEVKIADKISLVSTKKSFDLNTKDIDISYNFEASVDRVYNLTRTGNFITDSITQINLLRQGQNLGLTTNISTEKLSNIIALIDKQITVNPIYPSIEVKNGNIEVNKGAEGTLVDQELLKAIVGQVLSYARTGDVQIPMQTIDPRLSDQEIIAAKTRGEKYLDKSISLKFEVESFDYNKDRILKFINPSGGYNDQEINNTILAVSKSVNRESQNPKFEFNGLKVSEFQPALDGITLDNQKLKDLLINSLDKLADSTDKNIAIDVPVTRTKSDVATNEINNLGIKEMIGRGTSTYFHSIPGRVFNVNLAASRINGTLIKPGDTFSFNQTLGDVSKLTGYKEAYIISEGRTILGDGGGVCQVSTTLFRATLNAGLPIMERTAHAYRVGYYEQNSAPGIDATVYAPSPDFKFKNDTPGYILIQAKNNPKNYSLVFELYGTSDGRVSVVSKPVVSNVIPALPTIYQDDPTLPAGTLKQTDFAASGAKITFNYLVTRNGESIYKKTFVSNYQPWAAIYLKGTGPAI